MENFELLIDLLQKEELNKQESELINSMIQKDPELKEYYDIYSRISNAAKNNSHLLPEEISEYILFKNGLLSENNSIVGIAPKIEAHLRKCPKCNAEFKLFNTEFNEGEELINNTIENYLNDGIINDKPRISAPAKLFPGRFALTAILSIMLLFLAIYSISNITKPAFYDLAKIPDQSEFSLTRGRATDDFQQGLKLLEENNFEKAIRYFDEDIKLNGNDKTIFYTFYITGLAYIESSQKSTLGLFPSFDKEKVLRGIENLEACIIKNNSQMFPDINMNADYYLAKANLMLGNKQKAINCIKAVINGKGSKMDEAAKMLNQLE